MREAIREVISRILRENSRDVARSKLGDISLSLRAERNGRKVLVPASWDENQQVLWDLLMNYHSVSAVLNDFDYSI